MKTQFRISGTHEKQLFQSYHFKTIWINSNPLHSLSLITDHLHPFYTHTISIHQSSLLLLKSFSPLSSIITSFNNSHKSFTLREWREISFNTLFNPFQIHTPYIQDPWDINIILMKWIHSILLQLNQFCHHHNNSQLSLHHSLERILKKRRECKNGWR